MSNAHQHEWIAPAERFYTCQCGAAGKAVDGGPIEEMPRLNFVERATPLYAYEPKPDITLYELALLLPYFINRVDNIPMADDLITRLGPAARHLKKL